jgi:hypothetical protein
MISSAAFENFSALCIVLNVICVLADHANKPAEFEDFLQLAGFVFWLLLCGEMLLHLLAQVSITISFACCRIPLILFSDHAHIFML